MGKMIIAFLILVLSTSNLYADLIAEVTTGVIKKPLITVISNNVIDRFPADVNSIIASDFRHNNKLQSSDNIQYEVNQKHDVPWDNIRADYVVLTKYAKSSSNAYNVEVQIFKRNETNYFQSIKYSNINASLARTLAHTISNHVYKKITGREGFFLTKLAYVRVINPYARYGRIYELVISDYDGYNQHVALRQTDDPIATPSWSNDGRFIAYSSYSSGSMGIYKLEIRTGKTTKITNYKGINSSPSYSSDDSKIVLALSKGYSDQTNIYIMNVENKSLTQLTVNGINTAPKFSPDNKNVIFTSDRGGRANLYIAQANSKYPQSLILSNKIYQAYEPSYTPDGKNIIFMHQKIGSKGIQIANFNINNQNIKILTKGKADASLAVAPYGNMIAYISTNSKGYNSLNMVSLDGETQFSLEKFGGEQKLIYSPSWSPKNF